MELRWFSTCDQHGVWSEKTLQYWDKVSQRWFDVRDVQCKDHEEHYYMATKEQD